MRNDARPIGEHSPASPVGGEAARADDEREDNRESHKHDRQSHVVNRAAVERRPDAPDDPVMPSSDASLRTRM